MNIQCLPARNFGGPLAGSPHSAASPIPPWCVLSCNLPLINAQTIVAIRETPLALTRFLTWSINPLTLTLLRHPAASLENQEGLSGLEGQPPQ